MTLYKIKDWDRLYENHQTRLLKRMVWVPVRNQMDNEGYLTLVDHPDGPSHFAAWIAILEVASRCRERGILSRADGSAHNPRSLAIITRLPAGLFEEALPRLVSIGWMTENKAHGALPQESRAEPQESCGNPAHEGKGIEGIEGKGTEGGDFDFEAWLSKIHKAHPQKRGMIQEARSNATSVLANAADIQACAASISENHTLWCESWRAEKTELKFIPQLCNWFIKITSTGDRVYPCLTAPVQNEEPASRPPETYRPPLNPGEDGEALRRANGYYDSEPLVRDLTRKIKGVGA